MPTAMPIISTLSIFSPDLSETINERILDRGEFTTVTDNDPSEVVPLALGLVSLYINSENLLNFTHVCLLKKGQRVATGQVRIKGINVVKLTQPVIVDSLFSYVPKGAYRYGTDICSIGYKKLPAKTGAAIYKALEEACPDQSDAFKKLLDKINNVTNFSSRKKNEDIAAEKDALGIALDIFGVDRTAIFNRWEGRDLGSSFLTGFGQNYVYEDDIIGHDLNTVPGYSQISKDIAGVVEFKNKDGEKLVVINANRKPLEHALGVDLIYFHRKYSAFTLVQYKMMEKLMADSPYYFNPAQPSHTKELDRMDNLLKEIAKHPPGTSLTDYRIGTCPIFFKVCKRLEFKSADTSIAPGAYVPLDQWKLLLNDPSTKGPKGGCQIGYHTLQNRYLGTQAFIEMVKCGFLGTQGASSKKIALFIEDAVGQGRSVMYAIDERN